MRVQRADQIPGGTRYHGTPTASRFVRLTRAGEAYAQVMEKLDLVKKWARLPSRSEILRLTLGAWRAVLVVLLLIR